MSSVSCIKKIFVPVLVCLFLGACSGSNAKKDLQVFCAASLTEVMTALADSFTAETGQKVSLSFASSGTLARQIQMGAPANLFLSANKQWVDYLINSNLVGDTGYWEIAGNALVLIANNSIFDKELTLKQAVNHRFAIGDPNMVPVGLYARQALENLDLWEGNQFLLGRDVKHVLKLVEMGEADMGIVYRTDAISSTKVRVLETLPENMHQPVRYHICMMGAVPHPATEAFLSFVKSPKAKVVWEKYGFNQLPQRVY